MDRLSRFQAPAAFALIVSTLIAAMAWTYVKTRDVRHIDVTGSAKKRIVSDVIQWTGTLSTENANIASGYKDLHTQVDTTLTYLKAHGISDDEVRTSAVASEELTEQESFGAGESRTVRTVKKGYSTSQSIMVTSKDVAKVERISREVTNLLEQGVPIRSEAPQYLYTKLSEVKIEMLAEASRDARGRAEQMVAAAGGGRIGKLVGADMGVINVNPADSSATSWDGHNDTTSLEKDLITIVHCKFELP